MISSDYSHTTALARFKMAALLRYSCRVGSFASRHKSCISLCNYHIDFHGGRALVRAPNFQKSVFPLVGKNFVHSSSSSQQQTASITKNEPLGSPHWKTFRYISVVMVALYPAAFLAPTPVIDWGIAIFFPLHSYWGTKEVLSDYIPEVFPNKTVTTTAVYLWAGISALTFIGLAYLNIADVGVCKAVAMLWKL